MINVELPSLLVTVSETRRPGPSVSRLCRDSLKNQLATLKGKLYQVQTDQVNLQSQFDGSYVSCGVKIDLFIFSFAI